MVLNEVAGVVVLDKGGVEQIKVVSFDCARCGGKGEHVIHGRSDLKYAFIAVTFHAVDPFWVHHARTHNAGNFLVQCADHGAFGAGVVVVVDWAISSLKGRDCGGCAAFKLVVVIAIELVMLAVILVLYDGLSLGEAGF